VRPLPATRRARRLAALGLALAFVAALPLVLSQQLVGTIRKRSTPARPPWQELAIEPTGGPRLRAWLAEGDPVRPAAVVVHGHNDHLESQRGSGERLHERGFTVLLPDLRAHGGSEGRYSTLGGLERDDVRASLAELRRRGHGRHGFLLVGASMGAVTVLRAAAEEPDVGAVVAEAPFDDYRSTVAHHARLYYGMPAWFPLVPAAIALAEWRAGFDASEVSAVDAARRTRAKLLLILDENDARMPEPVVRRVFDAHPGPKRLWVAPGARHAGAPSASGYWETVLGFVEGALQPASGLNGTSR
jgi:alpha-beta hydrolase superfamily lysophospholipase